MPRDGQADQGATTYAEMVLQMLGLQRELVKPLGQGLEALLPLQPGQGGAQAVMDARPEGHMGVRIAGDVKPVRLREHFGVPVGGGDEAQYPVVLTNALALQFHILHSAAPAGLDGSIIAQALLCGAYHPASRVLSELLPLVWMLDESQSAIAQEVEAGLMSGHEQQDGIGEHLLPGVHSLLLATDQHG